MIPDPSTTTRLVALLGDPVDHSLSPRFQNAAIAHLGLDAVYLALRCSAEAVPGLLRGIALAGGGGNVTVPHKQVAARSVDEATEAVARTAACNTFWLEGGRVWGDNTDVEGFRAAVKAALSMDLAGARVLLIGAGGAAGGAAYALVLDRADQVVILNRSRERAEALRARFAGDPTAFALAEHVETLRNERFDLVVNTTSLGLRPDDALPLSDDAGIEVGAALDLVYRPGGTAWVRTLAADGVPAADGLEMLLRQGAASFRRWWGIAAPLEVMRDAASA